MLSVFEKEHFQKAQQVKRKQNFLLEFPIFLTTKLDGTTVICVSIPQSTLQSISECLQLRLFAAVQMGQELSFSSLSSSCSAVSKKHCFFILVPDQLVAFKEKPICCTVVHKNQENKKPNKIPPNQNKKNPTIQPNKQKIEGISCNLPREG